jgi:hypothetical protein
VSESKRKISLRNPATRRTLLTGVAFIAGFIVLAVLGIQLWEWSNSTAFCANACHDVHPEEPAAYQDSYHARVLCTECHISRVGTLYNITLKASHLQHLPAVLLNRYEHPLEAETLRPVNESCELCHWPPAFHGDTVREIRHFEQDEENTEERTYLILRTGGGERERGLGQGIHWHIENQVEFITANEDDQDIPWIRATFPDGSVVEYNDVTDPLSAEEIAAAEIHVMDCVDCHNRIGHPFAAPDQLIDRAIAEGRLSADLPFIKHELMTLFTASYADQEEALEAVGTLRTRYASAHPEAAATHADELEQAAQLAEELITRLVFEEPGITWMSFPNNSGHGGHAEFAGCFRCHDGRHLSAEGESIRLHCNICHSIPLRTGAGDRPPAMPLTSIQEPPSHLATNFVADHRFQASEECTVCHGEVAFGSDDSSFCANSACHGQAWPSVELDAAFPHPIELEGAHAEVWCHTCHEGVERPAPECANCHEPPMEPHFGDTCEDCHTPQGFELAELAGFEHPVELEGAHATLDCLACHTAGQSLTYECAACHEPPSDTHFGPDCEDCHTPAGFQGAELPPELHPVPLIGAHLRATCNVCHAEGARVPEYVCTNCHLPPPDHLEGACDNCHTPEGWEESAAFIVDISPAIPHTLAGREDCLLCHDPAGQIEPAPADHRDRTVPQCGLCHRAVE